VTDPVGDAVERLLVRHPDVDRAVVASVLFEAAETIIRVIGRPDLDTAEDLAELRLQVRANAGYPG
jgi:hypothetical protein